MPKLELEPEAQEKFNDLAEKYARLKESQVFMEDYSKSVLKQLRDAMDIITEDMASIMETVRDNDTDRATVRTTVGTFFTKVVMSFKVTDPEALRQQVLNGEVPSAVYDGGINKKAMQEVMEKRMEKMGYYKLSLEEKANADLMTYAPPGVAPRPYELIRFRKARS